MPRILVPLTNFQFGEVSPSLVSRTDTKVYPNSAKTINNFLLRNEGGLVKRFGSKKIYEFDTTYNSAKSQQHRLIPFIFLMMSDILFRLRMHRLDVLRLIHLQAQLL